MGYTEIEYDQVDDTEEENNIYAMDFKNAIVGTRDTANQAMLAGRVNASVVKTSYYPTISNAQWVADVRLKSGAYPLAKIMFPTTRQMFKREVGDLFILNYRNAHTGESIENMICRTISIEERSPTSEDIKVNCIEDIHHVAENTSFGADIARAATGASAYSEGQSYSIGTSGNNSSPAVPEAEPGEIAAVQKASSLYALNHVTVVELPYGIKGSSDLYFAIMAAKRNGTEVGFTSHLSITGTTYSQFSNNTHFAYCGILTEAYTEDTYRIDDYTGITFDIYNQSLSNVETIERAMAFTTKHICLIDDELLSFETITPDISNDHRYVLSNVIRGLYGTKVVTHSAGALLWIIGDNGAVTPVKDDSIVTGAVRRFKALPYSQALTGLIAECAVVKVTFDGLAATPYPPVNLKVNSGRFRPTYSTGNDAVISWTPRLRGSGSGIGIADSAISLATPTYEGEFYVEILDGSTVKRATFVSALTWTYTNAMMVTDFGSEPASFTVRISNVFALESTTIQYQSDTLSLDVRKAA